MERRGDGAMGRWGSTDARQSARRDSATTCDDDDDDDDDDDARDVSIDEPALDDDGGHARR